MHTVAIFDTIIDAYIAMGRLKAVEISCALQDEHLVQTDMLYSFAVGGIKLQVEAESVELARKILTQDYSDLVPPETSS